MSMSEVTLIREAAATRIPAGDPVVLPAGGIFSIAQALGGSVTLRDGGGLYRVAPEEFAAFGEELAASLAGQAGLPPEGDFSEDLVWTSLRQCFDPEIPLNIVDLGLIYDMRVEELEPDAYRVAVKMTLTAPGCGMGPTIANDARQKIEAHPAVREAAVEIVWDPQWSPHMISDEGRRVLGLN